MPVPESLATLFASIIPRHDPAVERRQMFGYPCIFAHGHLCAGVHKRHLILRLSPSDHQRFLAARLGTRWQPSAGRVMREYVSPFLRLHGDRRTLRRWIARSIAYCATLPPRSARGVSRHSK